MRGIEEVRAPERRGDRQAQNARQKRATAAHAASDQRLPPSTATGRSAAHNSFCSRFISDAPGQVSTGSKAGASGTAMRSTSMSSASAMTTVRAGRWSRYRTRARSSSGMRAGVVDLGRPLGDRSEHRAVVESWKAFALAHLTPDLADEQDHRASKSWRRDVQPADALVARARGNEADAGRPSPCPELPP